MSRVIRYENLVDANGKTIEIEVPDDFDENNESYVKAGKRGKAFGAICARAAKWDHKMAACLEAAGAAGKAAGEKFVKEFGKNQE